MRRRTLLAAFALVAAFAAPAAAQTHMPTAAEVAEPLAESWIASQRPDGSFPDYVTSRTGDAADRDRYGPAMLAAALLAHGARTGKDSAVAAGLRSLRYAIRHEDSRQKVIFENLALATAYNSARTRFGSDARFTAIRRPVERRLQRMQLRVFGTDRPYFNYYLVETVAVLELLRSGLSSKVKGSVLADKARARRHIQRLLTFELPRVGEAGTTSAGSDAIAMTFISDPPASPQAYHAMNLGLLGRTIELMGAAAPAQARALLRRMAFATWGFMAPDGDLSWHGRSQQQSWTLALTAAGAGVAAREPDIDPTFADSYRAAAQRSLLRFAVFHAGGPGGLWIVPSAGTATDNDFEGLDGYAAAASYSGLTLLGLEWAALTLPATAAAADDRVTPIAGDFPGGFVLDRGPGAFAVARKGSVWFSIKLAPAVSGGHGPVFTRDLRYDSGLSALKLLDGRGWRTIVPPRPRTRGSYDGAGPLLITGAGVARPAGTRLTIAADGSVLLNAKMRTVDRRSVRTATLVFEPIVCGVRIHVPARPGEIWEYSGFFLGTPSASPDGAVSDGTQVIRATWPSTSSITTGWRSGAAALTRAALRFAAASGPFVIEVCGTE